MDKDRSADFIMQATWRCLQPPPGGSILSASCVSLVSPSGSEKAENLPETIDNVETSFLECLGVYSFPV